VRVCGRSLMLTRHTFVAHSQNITMTNLDMNATSSSRWGTVNTDGFDSWNSQDIVLRNWVVTCGDVCLYFPSPYSHLTLRRTASQ
jgi:galacturan 1,4-alpha-galacturonidase